MGWRLVALLIAPAVVLLTYGVDAQSWMRWTIAGIAGLIIVFAVTLASRRSHAGGIENEGDDAARAEGHSKVDA